MEQKIKVKLFLEVSNNDETQYLEGLTFETSKSTIAKDCRENALKTWTREQIKMGGLTYDDLTNKIYSCSIHSEAFPEYIPSMDSEVFEKDMIKTISEQQNKLFQDIFAFDKLAKTCEIYLVNLFKRQYPDVELFSGKIHVNNGHITINGMQYSFSNGNWKKI